MSNKTAWVGPFGLSKDPKIVVTGDGGCMEDTAIVSIPEDPAKILELAVQFQKVAQDLTTIYLDRLLPKEEE